MLIAHVLSSFGIGGQERVALDLARGQVAAGHEVMAVSIAPLPEGPHAANFRAAGVRVHHVPKASGVELGLVLRLHRLFRDVAPAIVHTHNPHAMIYGAPAGKLASARVVHSKHGANPDRLRRRWLRRWATRFVDAYVAVSPTTADVARRAADCSPAKLRVIPNGIDLTPFGPDPALRQAVRRELGISAEAQVVGTVGRLSPEKNQALLIEALAPALSDSLVLLIVGSGPEEAKLRALARALPKAERVIFAGGRTDVARLLTAFDVFALTSLTEGLPLVIPEAMASALPIVSTAVGGIPDVVEDSVTGILVRPADVIQLRRALLGLLRDPERARLFGERAQRVAHSRYGVERMLNDYMQLYAELLARTPGLAPRAIRACGMGVCP